MKIYSITNKVYHYYQRKIKGNEGISFNQAQMKLSRNIAMAIKVPNKFEGKELYLYGNLHIFVDGNRIVGLRNHWETSDWFYVNKKKQRKLNEQLGIQNSETEWNETGYMDYADEYAKGYLAKTKI